MLQKVEIEQGRIRAQYEELSRKYSTYGKAFPHETTRTRNSCLSVPHCLLCLTFHFALQC